MFWPDSPSDGISIALPGILQNAVRAETGAIYIALASAKVHLTLCCDCDVVVMKVLLLPFVCLFTCCLALLRLFYVQFVCRCRFNCLVLVVMLLLLL